MKSLVLAAYVFLFAQSSIAGNIIYGCHPLEPSWNNPVEGAIVRVEDGKEVLAHYLRSKKWGAVDEIVGTAQIQANSELYVAATELASLSIDLRPESQIMEGEFAATLKVAGLSESVPMFCYPGDF